MSPHEKDYDDVVADLTNENNMLKKYLDRANRALDLLMNHEIENGTAYNGLQSNIDALNYIKTRRNRNGENEE